MYGQSGCVLAYIAESAWARKICWSSSSKVAVGNGVHNSKMIVSTIWLICGQYIICTPIDIFFTSEDYGVLN